MSNEEWKRLHYYCKYPVRDRYGYSPAKPTEPPKGPPPTLFGTRAAEKQSARDLAAWKESVAGYPSSKSIQWEFSHMRCEYCKSLLKAYSTKCESCGAMVQSD